MAAKDVLVSTQWLAEHLSDSSVKPVEVDVDTNAYSEGHVPGAIGWNWTTELQDQKRRDVVTREQFEELMGQSGVRNDDTVVLYGDNNNWFAAYAFWLLEMYGHRNLKLMDGGRKKWVEEGRQLTKDVPSPAKASYKASVRDEGLRARRDDMLKFVGGGAGKAMVDVRSPAEFSGEILAPPGLSETAQRGGHIPGAANIPWSQAVREDGTFKPVEELRQLYQGKGVTADKDIVAYCRIGECSSHSWFALKHLLDYPKVRNYDGSWTEWGSMVDVPVEKP